MSSAIEIRKTSILDRLMLRDATRPDHGLNRMRHEGDVGRARQHYFSSAPKNLKVLLENRYEWMNRYINEDAHGIEVGCGTGLSKEFIRSKHFQLTDLADHPWIDVKHVDALNTPFDSNSLDFVVSSNMIHHVPTPQVFFREMHRILKPNGRLLIQEINASFAMRMLLRLMRHEGYSFEPNVFSQTEICTDPNDLWSANCAIPNLLFDDIAKFEANVPGWQITETGFSECLMFANSGGVIAKTAYVPLPNFALQCMRQVDRFLSAIASQIFAMQRRIVLTKT